MKKKNKKRNILYVIVILLIFLLAIFSFENFKQEKKEMPTETEKLVKNISISSLSLEDFVKVKINITENNILLIYECKVLPIGITAPQAYSIYMGKINETAFRPTTHDIIHEILEHYGIDVMFVKVTELKGGTYFAELYLKKGNRILNIDTRPSDAIAIAVRSNSPVYLKKDLLKYAEEFC